MDTPVNNLTPAVQERIAALTDGSASTLEEFLDQVETTTALMLDFQDDAKEENTKFVNEHKVSARLIKALWLANKTIKSANAQASMFFSQELRDQIDDFLTQYKELSKTIGSLREPPF